jgi:hypothetical protein
MKRIILLVFLALLIKSGLSISQTLPLTTGHSSCYGCVPSGWINVQGGHFAIANRFYHGKPEIPYIGFYPVISGTPVLPPIPSGASTFLGMNGGWIKAPISNLIVGQKYKISYNIISTKANYKNSGIDYSGDFCNLVSFRVKQNGQTIVQHQHAFLNSVLPDNVNDHGIWRSGVFEFVAVSTSAEFELEPAQNDPGFIGLDLGPNAITPCVAGITAVPLKATSYEILCPQTSVNLITEFFGGLKPEGTEIRFFNNPTHVGLPLSNINVGAGTYYAFYYDPAKQCYNQDVSTAKIDVTYRNCVDLTPTLTINGLSFPEGGSRDFVVNLYEVNNRETSGNISFRITKVGGFNITYPTDNTLSNVAGGTMNQNKNWTFTENNFFITATSSVPIPANGAAVIGFKIERKPGISKGVTQNITPTVLVGAGGDVVAENNNSVTSASTN